MSEAGKTRPRYVVDEQGRKTDVVLPIEDYRVIDLVDDDEERVEVFRVRPRSTAYD